jgi:hypothetical protein
MKTLLKSFCLSVGLLGASALIGILVGTTMFPADVARAQNTPNYIPDPCFSQFTAKSSVAINVASATTTQLVAGLAGKQIFVCGFTVTISEVTTTANTIGFESSAVASCASSNTALTGLFGAGGVTAGAPIVVASSNDGSDFVAPAGANLCAVTAIGASGSFQGVMNYVQQ